MKVALDTWAARHLHMGRHGLVAQQSSAFSVDSLDH